MVAILSNGSFLATYDYYQCSLASLTSNSFCGGFEYPTDALAYHPPASFSGSPPSNSCPKCWSPQST
ncbi:pancreatic progenitor cell differentiation and proliferation factor-like [Rattus rattus]|uniref:pancreatic progenitor cell differentiation and proliferation factor-like n=1 Tax=Rattus rattus TaxID=10117 RepID=UPI0013F2DAEE|nr:pancreatic progenitor cell differentiation and proliferation factor-like [Rattus rattus]